MHTPAAYRIQSSSSGIGRSVNLSPQEAKVLRNVPQGLGLGHILWRALVNTSEFSGFRKDIELFDYLHNHKILIKDSAAQS
jgi:hypothetical protein